jgi:nickel superoxide dismutase
MGDVGRGTNPLLEASARGVVSQASALPDTTDERTPMFAKLFAPTVDVSAHCDLPCGVYDPAQARIEAESCYKIIEKYNGSSDELLRSRCIDIKEQRAELTKHHIDVLWHDYFKPEHVEKFPDLHDTCWKASKAASKVKQTTDLEAAKELLSYIDKIDEMWRSTGGPEKTRLQAAAVA